MIASSKRVIFICSQFLFNDYWNFSLISSVIIFDDLMLSALKTVFQIAQNNNVMKVIPNEHTNFDFKFSVFEFSEFECFGSISHSLITVLIAWTHKKVYINMA